MGEIIVFAILISIVYLLLVLIWDLIKWLFTTIIGLLVVSLMIGVILIIVGINKEINKCKVEKLKKDLKQDHTEYQSDANIIPTVKDYLDQDTDDVSDQKILSQGQDESLYLNDMFSTQLKLAKSKNKRRNRNSGSPIHKLRRPLSNYVVVDTETTGLSVSSDHIIQLSALKYKNDKLVGQYNQLIYPDTNILDPKITELTGITIGDLKDKPRFMAVKDDFLTFVGDLPWIGYNINKFDIPILINNGLGVANFYSEDAYLLAKQRMPFDIPNRKLSTLKLYFGINNISHDALEDCKTTAVVYQHLRDNNLSPTKNRFLKDKRFATIGKIASKKYINYFIALYGGEVKKSISHKVDYLIKGKTNGVTKTEEKAREYGIPIISYVQVMKWIEKGKRVD